MGQAIYGSLPEQLREQASFASCLKRMLAARKKYRLALGTLLDVPEVEHSALCVLIYRLPGKHAYALTAFNFARNPVRELIDLSAIKNTAKSKPVPAKLIDAITDKPEGTIGEDSRFELKLDRLSGKVLIVHLDAEASGR